MNSLRAQPVEWSATIAVTDSEAHLEARAGERFGAEEQHDQRARGDEADADRIPSQRDSGENQKRRDAASHRRHLRAGEQGVADAGRRGDRGRDQHQVEAQRQALAQRKQLEAEQHGESDHRGDMQPADRQQVGEAAAPHGVGVVLIDRILVAGHQRDRDSGRIRRQPLVDVLSKAGRARARGRAARPA